MACTTRRGAAQGDFEKWTKGTDIPGGWVLEQPEGGCDAGERGRRAAFTDEGPGHRSESQATANFSVILCGEGSRYSWWRGWL
jgi:uncharacterized protein YbdZ (MbtH family)